jgi:Putative zinc-finger
MTASACTRWHGDIAMRAIGGLDPESDVGLQAHLDGCPECRADAAELTHLEDALRNASPDSIEDLEADRPPLELQGSVIARLGVEAHREHRRVRRWIGAGVTAAVAAAAVVLIAVPPSSPSPVGRTVALAGPPGTSASIVLSPSASGSDVTLREQGQPPGQDFVVTMQTASGSWWQAGSYHTSGTTVRTHLTCAVAPGEITEVWVKNGAGRTVLSAYIR